jgi:hypothetical protein
MSPVGMCRVCRAVGQGEQLRVLAADHQIQDWHLCGRCWSLLRLGLAYADPADNLDDYIDPRGLLLSRAQVHDAIQLALRRSFRHRYRTEQP